MLVNCPLLLPPPRDQLVRMPVNVRVRSFPATIRETSSRPNRHLCHRGSHNDDDHGCKIIRFPASFRSPSKNRSEAAARAFYSAFHEPPPSKVERPHQQPPERLWETFIRGYPRHRAPTQTHPGQDVNHLTIDTISYILSQMLATCRRGDERQAAKRGSP